MKSINIPRFGNVNVVADTFAELRSISSNKIQPGWAAFVNGALQRDDGLGGLYLWNETSTEADNGETVIRPSKSVVLGRWTKLGRNAPAIVGPPGPKGDNGEGISTYLHDWHETGDTHDMQAVWRAYRAGFRRVIAAAGKGLGAQRGAEHAGKYVAVSGPWSGPIPGQTDPADPRQFIVAKGNLALPDDGLPDANEPMHGLQLVGEGMGQTVWRQFDNYAWFYNAKSADESENLRDVYFADFTVEGLGGAPTQNGHIFAMGGVTRPTWKRVRFTEPSSDGVCFQPSPNPDLETHNYYPTFRDCVFDGGPTRGRNCISVEDAIGGLVEGCKFQNWCSSTDLISVAMIDFEPRDQNFLQVGNWNIVNNLFEDSGRGCIAIYLNGPDLYAYRGNGIVITGNTFRRAPRSLDLSGGFDSEILAATNRHGIIATNNIYDECGDMRIQGLSDVLVADSHFTRCETLKLGDQNLGKGNINVRFERNTLTRCGKDAGICVLVDAMARSCTLSSNRFIECGNQSNTTSPGYIVIGRYGPMGIEIADNRVENYEGRIKAGYLMVTDAGGASLADTSSKSGNTIKGAAFTVLDTFNPPVAAAGLSAVYTLASGASIGSGGTVFFDIALSGATVDKFFVAKLDAYLPTSTQLDVTASCIVLANVVRVLIRNSNAGLSIPAGRTLTIKELFA